MMNVVCNVGSRVSSIEQPLGLGLGKLFGEKRIPLQITTPAHTMGNDRTHTRPLADGM